MNNQQYVKYPFSYLIRPVLFPGFKYTSGLVHTAIRKITKKDYHLILKVAEIAQQARIFDYPMLLLAMLYNMDAPLELIPQFAKLFERQNKNIAILNSILEKKMSVSEFMRMEKDPIIKNPLDLIIKYLPALYIKGVFTNNDTALIDITNRLSDRKHIREFGLTSFEYYKILKDFDSFGYKRTPVFIKRALIKAIEHSAVNIPRLEGVNAIILATEGYNLSSEMAAFVSVVLNKRIIGDLFWATEHVPMTTDTHIFPMVKKILKGNYVSSLDEDLKSVLYNGVKYDNLIIVSNQDIHHKRELTLHNGQETLKKILGSSVAKRIWIYDFNSVDYYGISTQVPVYSIAGYTDQIIPIINTFSNMRTTYATELVKRWPV